MPIPFDLQYAHLPERFYQRRAPWPVDAPVLRFYNRSLAADLGFPETLTEGELTVQLSGNAVPEGARPLAQAYAGHQFGYFVPQLGDGRALLLGEVRTPAGDLRDVQLKGSGPTAFSRGGDGRAPLGPVLRECLVSEAMAAMGVPTTRTLAVVSSDTAVVRERVVPAGVLTRVAASHLRVGTIQYFAARKDPEAIHELVRMALQRHYPADADAVESTAEQSMKLLQRVAERQAALVAQWMSLGFIHGVLNTDNVSLAGETIDYGPCAFMEAFRADALFSSVDQNGRYAYNQQPTVMAWNLARLAEALLSGESDSEAYLESARGILDGYFTTFEVAWLTRFRHKLGLSEENNPAEDRELVESLLRLMEKHALDFTNTWLDLETFLSDGKNGSLPGDSDFSAWLDQWRERVQHQPGGAEGAVETMRRVNPRVIPRNHLVEAVIEAGLRGDFAPFDAMRAVVTAPFSDPDEHEWTLPARPEEAVHQTFCGT